MRDLIVLCADQDTKLGIEALLRRGHQLGFRDIDFEVSKHDMRDSGVLREAHSFLRPQCKRFSYAITICDLEGCERERRHPRQGIEAQIEQRLQSNGWEGRAAAIVIAPELEAWVWVDWNALADQVGWSGGEAALKNWLAERDFLKEGDSKPQSPKESLRRILRQVNRSASSSLFAAVGRTADTSSCADPAFSKLISCLRAWFPLRGNAF